MAGINSTIRINDGMSPALKSMNKALNIVLNSFEALQSASGNAINTTDIVDARNELNNAAVAVNRLEEELKQAEEQQEKLTKEAKNTESAMGSLMKKVGGLIAAYATFQTVVGAINLSDKMSQTSSRLSLISDNVEELEKKIFASANRSRAAYMDTAAAVAAFAQRAGDAFSGNDEVIAFTETLNKMYVIAGASQQEQSSSMLQLTQALGSGVLRGEEFNAVFEAAPNIMQAVADYMQVPIGALREMAAEGQITADIVKNAIFNATEQVNEDFNNMKWTWQQVFTTFKNFALQSLDPVLTKISELANNKDVQNFAVGLGVAITTIASAVLWIFALMIEIGSFIYEHWSLISPVIYGVTAALMVYYGALLGVKIAEMASAAAGAVMTFGKLMMAAATWAATGATWAQATAQYGLNAALYACPLVWILILIIAIIAIFYLLIAVINKVAGTSISATGIIVGALASAGAFIWNLFLGLVDLVLGVVNFWFNIFATFANFFGNLFNDPIASIIRLFGGLADAILGVLESIAKAMDKVFGTKLSKSVSEWRDGLDSKIEAATKKHGNGSYEKVMKELNLSSESLGLNRISYSNAWDAGYAFGEGVDDTLSNFSLNNMLDVGANQMNGMGDMLEGIGGGVGDIADNTGSISDNMEITEEDLKYLRDIAEQEAINRFTTAEIRIDMQNNNSINSNMDIDGIVTQLEEKLYESMEIAAEGVH